MDIVVTDSPFMVPPLIRGIAHAALKTNAFSTRICPGGSAGEEERVLSRLAEMGGAGIIITCLEEPLARAVAALGRPTVNLMAGHLHAILPTVMLDDAEIGRVAARHLLDQGYMHLAYCGPPDFWVSRDREAGFLAQARQARRWSTVVTMGEGAGYRPGWTELGDPARVGEWVRTLPKPAGVLAFNDGYAQILLEACDLCGVRVPEELAIVGVDNNELHCLYNSTPLSSVDPDIEGLGHAAGQVMARLLAGEAPPPRPLVISPRGVVERRSSQALAVRDAEVQAALRFIREHAAEGIEVEDVLDSVQISRSSLERKFRDALGRLPGEEIRRVRMAHAARLLRESSAPLAEVAAACGFSYLSNFCASFKRAHGCTPRAYRQRQRLAGRR